MSVYACRFVFHFFFSWGRDYAHDLGTINGFFHYTYRHTFSLSFSQSLSSFHSLSLSRHLVILSVFFFFSLPKFFFTRSPFFTSIPLSLCVFFVTFQKNSVVLVSTIILDYINYLLITLYYIFWFSLWCLRRFSFFPPLFFFFFFLPSLNFFFFFFFSLG